MIIDSYKIIWNLSKIQRIFGALKHRVFGASQSKIVTALEHGVFGASKSEISNAQNKVLQAVRTYSSDATKTKH